jgi:DNA-binding SARP family transcriptional activator/tetratricopeptide (TPR) repeat protein/energy-coupling factor transporter ATP-binding protein EcfA2
LSVFCRLKKWFLAIIKTRNMVKMGVGAYAHFGPLFLSCLRVNVCSGTRWSWGVSLEIYLLGQFKLKADDRLVELPSRPAQGLLAYLALNAGATLRREKLASLLWVDSTESNARGYLRQAFWRIRKSLETGSLRWENYLQISEISVTFDNHSDYWLDVEQLIRPPDERPLDELIAEIELYRGELLPGFYDSWVGLERDRLQTAYFQKMNYLLEHLLQARRWDETIRLGEQWILHGYSPEPAYRALMKAYAGSGDAGMAIATYLRCVEALDRDLGVEPSLQTRRLNEQIKRGDTEAITPSVPILAEVPRRPPFLDERWEPVEFEKHIVVARERQLEQLARFLELAISGQGRVVLITGEAGSGKTTLVNEFTERARKAHPNLIFANGNCNAYTGIGDPYLPFREILALLSGDVGSRLAAGAISRPYAHFLWNLIPFTVQALLEASRDLIDTFVPGSGLYERAVAYATGEPAWLTRLDQLLHRKLVDPESRNPHQSDLFIQYSNLLHILSRQGPIVLVLDDLQWADLGSISLIFHLGRQLSGKRILIVGSYRPEELALGRAGERHPLEPVINELQREFGDIEVNLDQLESRVFVEAILNLEPNRLGRQFRDMLCDLTHGHPLFTIELLRGMQERRDLVQDDQGRWVEGASLDWETLPARVEAVIGERVGRLDPSVQATLRIASVEGEIFTAEVVASVQSLEASKILRLLSNELDKNHHLVRAQSIQRIGGQLISSYRFRHILVQKYLYNSLDPVERVHLHEQVGISLEDLYGSQLGATTLAPQLARHFQEAKLTEKAIHYLELVGVRALQVSAYQEANAHLERGLALLASLPNPQNFAQQELSLQLAYGMGWHLARGFTPPEMERAYIRALELCQVVGNKTQHCQILAGLSNMYYVRGDYSKSQELAEEMLGIAQQAGDPLLIALGYWCHGITLFVQGEFKEARSSLEQIAAFYEPHKHHRPLLFLRGVDLGLSGLAYLACCLWCLGYPEQAMEQSQQVLALARQLDHSFTLADVLRYGGCELHKYRRDAQSLKLLADELVQVSGENNFPAWLVAGRICQGEALIMAEQFEEGIDLIRRSITENLARNVSCTISGSLLILAEAYVKLGDPKLGRAVLAEAFEFIEQAGETYMTAEGHRVHSELLLSQGDEVAAEASLHKALEIAHRQEARSWELRAAIDLALLWKKQGKLDEASRMVSEIYSCFTEGFDTPELRQAQELINPLCDETM